MLTCDTHKKNFSVSAAIADAPDGVTWSVPWAMTSFRTGKQRFSLIFYNRSYAKNEKMEKWLVFFSTYRPDLFLDFMDDEKKSIFPPNLESLNYSTIRAVFSRFPPGNAQYGVHVAFDRTERGDSQVDWRRFHIVHSELFRRDED